VENLPSRLAGLEVSGRTRLRASGFIRCGV